MARPTGRGVALLVAAAATYIAARVVGTWELYLVALAFGAAPLIALLHVTVAARRLEGARSVSPAQPSAGDPLTVSVRVRNGSLLPGPQVTAADAAGGLGGSGADVQVQSLGPRRQRVVTSRPRPARRGVHRLPALPARAEDPLGLARAHLRLGEPLDVTVHPRLVDLPSCALYPEMGVRPERGHRGLTALGVSEFRGVRPHEPGEPLSRIDWKSTARTGTLMLREMDDPTSGDVALLLHAPAPLVTGEPPATNLELAVEVAGSVADFALRASRGVTLLLPQGDWRRTRLAPGADSRRRLLEELARVTAHADTRLGPSLNVLLGRRRARSRIVTVIVLGLDAELVRVLAGLRGGGMQVSVVHVDAASFDGTASSGRRGAPGSAGRAQSGDTPDDLHVALAAAGVRCLTLRRDDDVLAALSLQRPEARHAGRREVVFR